MPTCTYQVRHKLKISLLVGFVYTYNFKILSGGPFGEPVEFGLIGQQVYHQWKCDNDKGMIILIKGMI